MFGKTKKHQNEAQILPQKSRFNNGPQKSIAKKLVRSIHAFFQWLPKRIYSVISILLVRKYHLVILYSISISDISTPIVWK